LGYASDLEDLAMVATELPCSDQTRAGGHPIAGSAVERTPVWLAVEVRAPWGRKGLGDTPLPAGLEERLRALAPKGSGVRVVFIRRPRLAVDTPCTLLLARMVPGREQVERRMVAGLTDVAQIDLEGWVAGRSHGAIVSGPTYLVCTHGKRDACCAKYGCALYQGLAALHPEGTWQASHLGGHRFAATLLALPEGVNFGLMVPGEAESFHHAWSAGRLFRADRVRGRVGWSKAVQAAEILAGHDLRTARVLMREELVEDGVIVAFEGSEPLKVRQVARGEQQASCVGAKRAVVKEWVRVS